jgi:uncharacterized protein (TIGR03067 family)
MNLLSLALVALTLFAGQAAPTQTPAPAPALSKEATSLQGTWNVTLVNDQAAPEGAMALQFEGWKYAVVINGGVDETGTFKLDATKTPWTFDLNIVEGSDAGKLQLGILEMKGDAIHGLLGTPGATARPANFDSADGAIAFVAVKVKK